MIFFVQKCFFLCICPTCNLRATFHFCLFVVLYCGEGKKWFFQCQCYTNVFYLCFPPLNMHTLHYLLLWEEKMFFCCFFFCMILLRCDPYKNLELTENGFTSVLSKYLLSFMKLFNVEKYTEGKEREWLPGKMSGFWLHDAYHPLAPRLALVHVDCFIELGQNYASLINFCLFYTDN